MWLAGFIDRAIHIEDLTKNADRGDHAEGSAQ